MRSQPGTRYSDIRAQRVFADEVSADGKQRRQHTGVKRTEVPVYRPRIVPDGARESLIYAARAHRDPELRREARIRLEGYAEELVGQFMARRRAYDAGTRIKLVAKMVVDETIHPHQMNSVDQASKILGINPGYYHDKRKNGFSWHDDIEYIREWWVDAFLYDRRL